MAIRVRILPERKEQLDTLANLEGASITDYVDALIRKAWQRYVKVNGGE